MIMKCWVSFTNVSYPLPCFLAYYREKRGSIGSSNIQLVIQDGNRPKVDSILHIHCTSNLEGVISV